MNYPILKQTYHHLIAELIKKGFLANGNKKIRFNYQNNQQ